MWFSLSAKDHLLNESNIVRIYADYPSKTKILIMAETVNNDYTKLGEFDSAEKASNFISLLKNEIKSGVAVIDIQTLINIAKL